MIHLECGRLGSLFHEYYHQDAGLPFDVWREGDTWHLRWGAHTVLVGWWPRPNRLWRIWWGYYNDQITLYVPKERGATMPLDDEIATA